MNKTEILSACTKSLPRFKEILKDESYQLRGVLNSEALLVAALAEHLGVSHIIESGRARGHSTNLLAKYFSSDENMKITSIDIDKHSTDAKYSERYLQKFENLSLVYGDSFVKVPAAIEGDCIVFMDGPKGENALELTSSLLNDKRVKAVFVHDLHRNVFPRNIAELIYSSHFFTDDEEFVESFKGIDEDCWTVMDGTGYAPYLRENQQVLSYGHTLGVFFNSDSPFTQPVHQNYLKRREHTRPTLKKLLIEKLFSFVNNLRVRF